MTFTTCERGQAFQLFFVLLLAFAVISVSVNQAVVIPRENEEREFEFYQQVADRMDGVRYAAEATGRTGSNHQASVPLGTDYELRGFGSNPPPASGRIRTTAPRDVAVQNTANNSTVGTALELVIAEDNYSTRAIVYEPLYNEFESASTLRYESSILYKTFDNGKSSNVSGQGLVDGESIRLTLVKGQLNRTGSETRTLDFRPVSAPAQPHDITNETGDNITITVPTELSEDEWRDVLEPEFTSKGGHVIASTITVSNSKLTFELEGNVTYQLHVAAVAVGDTTEEYGNAQYITNVTGNNSAVPENGTEQLVTQVRDRYHNPVAGVTVNQSSERISTTAGTVKPVDGNVTTDEDGKARFVYVADQTVTGTESDKVELGYGPTSERDRDAFSLVAPSGPSFVNQSVLFNLTVVETDAGPPGFQSVSATRLLRGRPAETQYLNFTLNESMASGDDVTIDLSDVVTNGDVTYSGTNGDISVIVDDGDGNTGQSVSFNGNKKIKYEPDSDGLASGTKISIKVENIDTTSSSPGVYDANFQRSEPQATTETGTFAVSRPLVFVDENNPSTLRVADPGSTSAPVTTYGTSSNVKSIGALVTNIDGRGGADIPFADGGNRLSIYDIDQNKEIELVDSGAPPQPISVTGSTRIGVGDFDGTQDLIFFVDNGKLKKFEYSSGKKGTVTVLTNSIGMDIQAQNIAGVGNFDGDAKNEVVYVNQNSRLRYLDVTPTGVVVQTTSYTVDNKLGVGGPADFGDGTQRVPVVTGSSEIVLVDRLGSAKSTSFSFSGTDEPQQYPIASIDFTGDGDADAIYINNAGAGVGYVTLDGNGGKLTDESDGTALEGSSQTGNG